MKNTLIVFARNPELGKVKTRLSATLGGAKTLIIYKKLLAHTLFIAANTKATVKTYWSKKNNKAQRHYQTGNDLGERMYNALTTELKLTAKVCLVGTDTPTLNAAIIEDAFKALEETDIVFGPALDGGYYLVACKITPPQTLFLNKQWSHSTVLQEAITACQLLDLKVHLLPTLMDIDTEEDYKKWQNKKTSE